MNKLFLVCDWEYPPKSARQATVVGEHPTIEGALEHLVSLAPSTAWIQYPESAIKANVAPIMDHCKRALAVEMTQPADTLVCNVHLMVASSHDGKFVEGTNESD